MTTPAPAGTAAPKDADDADTDTGVATGDAAFDSYADALSHGDTPLLGHMVLYSISDGIVTPDKVAQWFRELDLDPQFAPSPLRAVDAYERITGPDGVRLVYALDNEDGTSSKRSRREPPERQATLMIRNVGRDKQRIVRHIVREVRDQPKSKLSYDTRLGEVVFERDNGPQSTNGGGALVVRPDRRAIEKLPAEEQSKVEELFGELQAAYTQHVTYLSGDKLRSLVRRYIEALNAIRVRKTGGVYFVHQTHTPTLARLRELVSRFGKDSQLVRVPLPDQEEMREMIVAAFTTKAAEDLSKLSQEIAAARRAGADDNAVQALYRRFQALRTETTQHAELLSTSLDDTDAALGLVKAQLGALLATAGTKDDDEPAPDAGSGEPQ